MAKSARIADLRVSRTTILFVRYVYPVVILWALILRRRNEKKASHSAEQLGKAAARVVVSSQQNAETLSIDGSLLTGPSADKPCLGRLPRSY